MEPITSSWRQKVKLMEEREEYVNVSWQLSSFFAILFFRARRNGSFSAAACCGAFLWPQPSELSLVMSWKGSLTLLCNLPNIPPFIIHLITLLIPPFVLIFFCYSWIFLWIFVLDKHQIFPSVSSLFSLSSTLSHPPHFLIGFHYHFLSVFPSHTRWSGETAYTGFWSTLGSRSSSSKRLCDIIW